MNLTAYSDSESDNDAPPAVKSLTKAAPKPGFRKVVDRANSGRIKVNLPGATRQHAPKDDIDADAPPAKKARLGGGGLSGFNAMLPAPKKANASASTTAAGSAKRGLGGGISLKTGAEPAFKREPKVELEEYDENGNPVQREALKKEDFRAMLNLPPPKTEAKAQSPSMGADASAKDELETEQATAPKPAPLRFVPLSVGKGKKKKPAAPRPAIPNNNNNNTASSTAPKSLLEEVKAAPRKPKVSLFGVSNDSTPAEQGASPAEYKPLLYGAHDDDDDDEQEDTPMPDNTYTSQHPTTTTSTYHPTPAPNNLTNIASTLNLSAAERRQLFGKSGRTNGPDLSSANIVEFNTDAEYAHNEKLRQQGEQVQHNALKSISGTGKNSLRSLVSAATTQKDALEEHFAAGYRNKKEAGNRYGW